MHGEIELITENLASLKEYSVTRVLIGVAQVAEDPKRKHPTQQRNRFRFFEEIMKLVCWVFLFFVFFRLRATQKIGHRMYFRSNV